jgi:hypothetical protein
VDTVFELSGHYVKKLFYDSADAEACPACGLMVDINWTNQLFKIGACHLDFGYTYDFAVIVSERFASLVRSWPGVCLDEITSSKGWFHLSSDQTVAFDPVGGRMEQLGHCEECGRFREVFAPFRGCLAEGVSVPPGLARTDTVFGSASESPSYKRAQVPMFVVNADYASLLRDGAFKGLILRPAEFAPTGTSSVVS